jgi:ribonuclease P protein component
MEHTTRLRKNSQFRNAISRGKSSGNAMLVLFAWKNGLEEGRIGVQVSKKVGKSVVRSRVTRLVRESFRLLEPKVAPGYDMVFIAKTPAKDATYALVSQAARQLLTRQGLLAREESS